MYLPSFRAFSQVSERIKKRECRDFIEKRETKPCGMCVAMVMTFEP